ncbi:MAG: hypothetical protein DWI25_06660 [Planctomycetota bacterium]|nr:MAG: hypothetical protein DWI25_06660 [Planctomycetota bacterium]
MTTNPPDEASGGGPSPEAAASLPTDFARFDELVESLEHWSRSADQWPPARRVCEQWVDVEPRLDRARRELSRVLVVGVIGGTGTGKSTLVNALAGCDVSSASDVARPTTIYPVVVVSQDLDLSFFPVDAMQARVVRSSSPAVANIVLIDCPDPDTQPESEGADRPLAIPHAHPSRPSDTNHNRDLLEAIVPACDVLLLVATAQKYRSWLVAREVAAFAPGRPLLFVQTHASRDPDIRGDWQKELESQGFMVPHIFRVDGLEAARRAVAGVTQEPEFQALVTAIDKELVGRAARRVRRTGAIDLAGWFLRESRGHIEPYAGAVRALVAGVETQQSRLEELVGRAIALRLRRSRFSWQHILTDEIVDGWQGGPFAMFLHTLKAIAAFWPRMRSAGGSLLSRVLAGQAVVPVTNTHGAWQAITELGLDESEVEQSRSILVGLAARARLSEPLVGRARLDGLAVQATVGTLLERSGAWLAAGIQRLVAERRGQIDGRIFRGFFELLFSGLLVAVLGRAGWNFFVGHLWLGRPVDGAGFLFEAFVWLVLWGFLLRWVVFARVRMGLDRDIRTLISQLPHAKLVDPLLADFAAAAEKAHDFIQRGERLERDWQSLARAVLEPDGGLGRLRREPL